MLARINRALIEGMTYQRESHTGSASTYIVQGSRGLLYKTTIDINNGVLTCECPDHRLRKKLCKHLILCLIKDLDTPIEDIDQYYTPIVSDCHHHSTQACPICYELIDSDGWKCVQCEYVIHRRCIQAWFLMAQKHNANLSCPCCRHINSQI